jgi:hypothetical protein
MNEPFKLKLPKTLGYNYRHYILIKSIITLSRNLYLVVFWFAEIGLVRGLH